MKIGSLAAAIIFGLIILSAQGVAAEAAVVKVLMRRRDESGDECARSPVRTRHGPQAGAPVRRDRCVKRQIDAGESFDVAILTTPLIDDLVKEGKIAAGTHADIARSGIGVIVRTGAPKPDISSANAFKRVMLDAKSISYAKEGALAIYLAGLFERLGITEQMQSKTKLRPAGRTIPTVAEGEVELGCCPSAASSPCPVPSCSVRSHLSCRVTSVTRRASGPLPRKRAAGKDLINFLKAPAAVPVSRTKGMEPMSFS